MRLVALYKCNMPLPLPYSRHPERDGTVLTVDFGAEWLTVRFVEMMQHSLIIFVSVSPFDTRRAISIVDSPAIGGCTLARAAVLERHNSSAVTGRFGATARTVRVAIFLVVSKSCQQIKRHHHQVLNSCDRRFTYYFIMTSNKESGLGLGTLREAREGGVRGKPTPNPPKIWNWGQKLHMALMSDKCQSNGNAYLSLLKINVSCYTIRLDFDPVALFKNGSQAPADSL